jgi:hypothetical protein
LSQTLANLRSAICDGDRNVRAQALRVVRYLLRDGEALKEFKHLSLDVFVVRSLDRDSKYNWERAEAIKVRPARARARGGERAAGPIVRARFALSLTSPLSSSKHYNPSTRLLCRARWCSRSSPSPRPRRTI